MSAKATELTLGHYPLTQKKCLFHPMPTALTIGPKSWMYIREQKLTQLANHMHGTLINVRALWIVVVVDPLLWVISTNSSVRVRARRSEHLTTRRGRSANGRWLHRDKSLLELCSIAMDSETSDSFGLIQTNKDLKDKRNLKKISIVCKILRRSIYTHDCRNLKPKSSLC